MRCAALVTWFITADDDGLFRCAAARLPASAFSARARTANRQACDSRCGMVR